MTAIPFIPVEILAFDTEFRGARRQLEPAARETFDLILEGFGEEALSPKDEEPAGTSPESAPAEVMPENRPDMFLLSLCLPAVQQQGEADRAQLLKLMERIDRGQATRPGETDEALPARPSVALPEGLGRASGPIAADTPEPPFANTASDFRSVDARTHGKAADDEAPRPVEKVVFAVCAIELPSEMEPLASAPTNPDLGATFIPSPALQILQQIDHSLTEQTGQPGSPSSMQQLRVADQPTAPLAELKSLRFMLQPENLGDVEVRLRRFGLEMKVTITVAGKAAAETLSRDMSILEDRLGGLLAAGPGGSVNVSLEVRDPEPPTPQDMQNSEEQGTNNEALPGGRGFAQDGRSGANNHHSPVRLSKEESNVEDLAAGSAAGTGRVV